MTAGISPDSIGWLATVLPVLVIGGLYSGQYTHALFHPEPAISFVVRLSNLLTAGIAELLLVFRLLARSSEPITNLFSIIVIGYAIGSAVVVFSYLPIAALLRDHRNGKGENLDGKTDREA